MRVFGLLPVVDSGFHQQRYGERSRQRLDLAILSLFQSFRKIYIGEQVMHSSKVSAHPPPYGVLRFQVCAADSAQRCALSGAQYLPLYYQHVKVVLQYCCCLRALHLEAYSTIEEHAGFRCAVCKLSGRV